MCMTEEETLLEEEKKRIVRVDVPPPLVVKPRPAWGLKLTDPANFL